MNAQTKTVAIIKKWFNKLEPDHLLATFFVHPPLHFKAWIDQYKLPNFSAIFDLLTTMDEKDRKKIQAFPFFKIWSRLTRYKALFIGTTVSEFVPFPSDLNLDNAARSIREYGQSNHSLIIVKDLPKSCELLTTEENIKNTEFLSALNREGFLTVEGQALAYVPIHHTSIDDYLQNFSKSRRKDFRRKLRSINDLKIDVIDNTHPLLEDAKTLNLFYRLYLQVYEQSEIHFDLLSEIFFQNILKANDKTRRVILYRTKDDKIIGYNICFIVNNMLVDKYIGLDYPAAIENNLYFVSWFYNLEYARKHHLDFYIAGWTDPEIKAYLGARFVYTQHAVFIKNPFLRWILKRFQHLFENDSKFEKKKASKN
ncbi:peptidogalycan biosysnthesis protein [Bartonella tamiae]|uniref:BioF2-like acetyltransferase domain-containing protein n=1 Tax=Bartonella tamiae Th239 TaxID=1094558 RepID=J0QTP6_9HYPH|nr:peptidogalycan biosysnthesis protein [Bartonella tamiae]EJF89281.1 hypothetical protein ME5_01832 [Bartonella tamiae Th239]EJF95557.1 hypothetical protein MEG_00047 [Bartonella tamiae Th307]